MKKLFAIVFMLIAIVTINAQNNFSVGLVGTRFSNTDNNNKLTQIENPIGYGIILGYAINDQFMVALTGEYFQDDMENLTGKETDYRFHLSGYLKPVDFSGIHPYVSAGVVYTNREFDYEQLKNEKDHLLNARIGAGLDYSLIPNINFNLDLGFYTDGLNFVGWTSSIGLRYGLNF